MATSAPIQSVPKYDPNATKFAKPKDAKELQADFLKMLTAQLQYQDPMEPMQNTEFTSQLAQFSSLSEQQRGNTLLEQLLGAKTTDQMNQGVGYIGRQVVTEGNRMQVSGGVGDLAFDLDKAATLEMDILDENGSLVRSVAAQKFAAGEQSLKVGTLAGDLAMADGSYTFKIRVVDGSDAKATTLSKGVVSGVIKGTDGVSLEVNGKSVAFDKIRRVELTA
ncbi:MAG: hypothetical protein HQL56_06520 [Magnetococcales bacterium]|nr:hypothetical protein [Magnetococcales bacterium]